jgi:hypothetical protein
VERRTGKGRGDGFLKTRRGAQWPTADRYRGECGRREEGGGWAQLKSFRDLTQCRNTRAKCYQNLAPCVNNQFRYEIIFIYYRLYIII